jgi:outer membrane protein TolC
MKSSVVLAAWLAIAAATPAFADDPPLSLSLRQAVEVATHDNPALRLAVLQTAAASLQVATARSAILPQVVVRASKGYATLSLATLGLSSPASRI